MRKWFLLAMLLLVAWTPNNFPPLTNDAFLLPDLAAQNLSCPYMIGRVALDVILPESIGGSEDWTVEEQAQVQQEINDAAAWWIARKEKAGLDFILGFHTRPTEYEPIEMPMANQGFWISQVMGHNSGSYFDDVRQHNADLLAKYQADWAFTVFVVDSSSDADGMFPDGLFAYAYLGGPFMVMTYDNANYGIANMDMVATHEIGHLFCALDQHHTARVPCDRRSGYLDVETQNSEWGECWLHEASIMKWPLSAYALGLVDKYARGQVGWWDQDCDDVLDPIDDFIDPGGCPVHKTYLPIICGGS